MYGLNQTELQSLRQHSTQEMRSIIYPVFFLLNIHLFFTTSSLSSSRIQRVDTPFNVQSLLFCTLNELSLKSSSQFKIHLNFQCYLDKVRSISHPHSILAKPVSLNHEKEIHSLSHCASVVRGRVSFCLRIVNATRKKTKLWCRQ